MNTSSRYQVSPKRLRRNRFASAHIRPELQAPLLDRLVGHSNAALGKQVLDLTEAQAKAVVEPHRVADDLGRESVSVVAELSVGYVLSVGGTRQLDNATPAVTDRQKTSAKFAVHIGIQFIWLSLRCGQVLSRLVGTENH